MIDTIIASAQWLGDEGMAAIFMVLVVLGLIFATNKNPS